MIAMVLLMIVPSYGQSKRLKKKYRIMNSHLTIKGKTVGKATFTYEVFKWGKHGYESVSKRKSAKGRYRITVNSRYNHKVVFSDDLGDTKTMYVNKANPTGRDYKYQLDIDFKFDRYFAELKRRGNKYKHYVHLDTDKEMKLVID